MAACTSSEYSKHLINFNVKNVNPCFGIQHFTMNYLKIFSELSIHSCIDNEQIYATTIKWVTRSRNSGEFAAEIIIFL